MKITNELNKTLNKMMHNAFCEIRMIVLDSKNKERVHDLADLFHEIPDIIYYDSDFDIERFKQSLIKYDNKNTPKNRSLLKMFESLNNNPHKLNP